MPHQTQTSKLFIGCDVSKAEISVAVLTKQEDRPLKSFTVANTKSGIRSLVKQAEKIGPIGLCVCEPTGGYEDTLVSLLVQAKWPVHLANTRKAAAFAKSLTLAKTDALDALALARYGCERQSQLRDYKPLTATQIDLKALATYREDLIKERTRLKNQAQRPRLLDLQKQHIQARLDQLKTNIAQVEEQAGDLIKGQPELAAKYEAALGCYGVGPACALAMVAHVPELGELNRKQVASLVGLAPHPKQSGTKASYQRTGKGRAIPRKALFMAALAASRKGPTGQRYQSLIARGKKPIVALIAVARKLAEHINAKCKNLVTNAL